VTPIYYKSLSWKPFLVNVYRAMIYRPDHRYYGLTWNHCSTTVLSWFDQSSALYIWSTLTIVKSVDVWMIFAGFWDGYDLGVTPRLRNSLLTDHPIEEGREQLFDSGAHRLQYFKKYFIITSCWSWLHVLQSCFKLRHLEWLFKFTTLSSKFFMTKLPPRTHSLLGADDGT